MELLSEIDVTLYGAFHQREHVANPRYVLNTSRGRFKTANDTALNGSFVPTNDENEPLWGNPSNGVEVILTIDENDKVIGIRPVES